MTSRKAECQLESLSRPVSLPTRSPAHHSSKLLTRTARGNSQGAKNNRQQPDLQLLAFGEKDMDDDAPGCSLMEAAFAATLKPNFCCFGGAATWTILQPALTRRNSLPSLRALFGRSSLASSFLFRVHRLHFCVFSTSVRVDTLEKRHLQARCICFVVGFVTSLSHIQDFVHHV